MNDDLVRIARDVLRADVLALVLARQYNDARAALNRIGGITCVGGSNWEIRGSRIKHYQGGFGLVECQFGELVAATLERVTPLAGTELQAAVLSRVAAERHRDEVWASMTHFQEPGFVARYTAAKERFSVALAAVDARVKECWDGVETGQATLF